MAKKKYSLIGEIADFDYHGIWGDFCAPRSLRAFLDGLNDGEEAEIEINSPGGLVIHGVEMANAIKNSKAKITAHVTGIAASMASGVACACDKIVMEEASFMMIHDPWGYTQGNADEMRKEAQVLDQMKSVIMAFYRGKFDRTEEEISKLMSEETWYTGAECLANGLKCEVVKSEMRAAASIASHHFAKIPEAAQGFLATAKELTDEGKAELAKAKAEAIEAAKAEAAAAESAKDEGNWKERYQGASKKINELQAKIVEMERDREGAIKTAVDEATAKVAAELKDLSGKFEESEKALADAKAEVSKLAGALEEARVDLAKIGEHAKHLEEVNTTITGGVLTPPEGGTYADKMKAAKTPEEREALRKQKASGKIK